MRPALKRMVSWALFLALIAFVVLYAAGAFSRGRIEPGRAAGPASEAPPARTTVAERVESAVVEEAVGTVRSRTRVVVTAQVGARVVRVGPQVGESVAAGAPIVTLDDREVAAALGASREALAAAEAARRQADQARAQGSARLTLATSRHDRVKSFLARGAATAEQLEAVEAELAQAKAGVADADAAIAAADARIAQARQIVAAAEVTAGHAAIAAPFAGVVVERSVEPGDVAWPGRPLLVLIDPAALRLDALVREGLIARIAVGAELEVDVPSAGTTLTGRVAEVVPSADPRTRTFEVRVAIPRAPGVLPGMFGRVRLPVGRREIVRVAAAAVSRVGQLETVTAREGDRWTRRLVSTGAPLPDGKVEILAGLAGGETVGLPGAPDR
jgi:RND family efflux transporter MFP subunit